MATVPFREGKPVFGFKPGLLLLSNQPTIFMNKDHVPLMSAKPVIITAALLARLPIPDSLETLIVAQIGLVEIEVKEVCFNFDLNFDRPICRLDGSFFIIIDKAAAEKWSQKSILAN